jgi:hypothetical protein
MSTVCSAWRILAQPGPGLGHPGVNMRRHVSAITLGEGRTD